MAGSKDINLSLWDCRGIRSAADLPQLLSFLRPLGLAIGSPTWTAPEVPQPVEDLTTYPFKPWVSDEGRRAELMGNLEATQTVERWSFMLVHIPRPQTYGNIFVSRRGAGTWDMLLSVRSFSHSMVGMGLDDFAIEWGHLLERLGQILYAYARPALAILTATGGSDQECSASIVEPRQLVIGWRTWYGPPYLEKFGRDWLLALPDRAELEADGGIAHALAAPFTAILAGDPSAYSHVWPYLDRTGVQPAWPRRRKRRASMQPIRDEDAASARIRSDVRGLLNMTVGLSGSQRMKMLPLSWKPLSALERAATVETVHEELQRELEGHPHAVVILETSELPDELRRVLDDLANDTGRFTYTVVPQLSPSDDETGEVH